MTGAGDGGAVKLADLRAELAAAKTVVDAAVRYRKACGGNASRPELEAARAALFAMVDARGAA